MLNKVFRVSKTRYNESENTYDIDWINTENEEDSWYWCSVNLLEIGLTPSSSEEDLKNVTMTVTFE